MSSPGGSSDPVILATAGYDHTIRFWQAHSGICHRTVQHPDSQVNDLEITPDRQLLAAAGYQHIRMYDLNINNPNPIINYDGISKNVSAVGFHEEGKWMYTGGEDNSARIWDLRLYPPSDNKGCLNPETRIDYKKGIQLMCVPYLQSVYQAHNSVTGINNKPLNPEEVYQTSLSAQGELFVGDQSGAIHIWDLKTDHNEQLIPEADASIQSINIDSEGTYMAAVNNRGNCYVWSLTGGKREEPTHLHPKTKVAAHQRQALKCLFSPDSTLLATTSADTTVKIWRTADFSLMTELKEQNQRWVWDCAFSGDSQYIITASSDNMSRLWNVETGEVKREYSGHQKAVVCLAFKDDVPE